MRPNDGRSHCWGRVQEDRTASAYRGSSEGTWLSSERGPRSQGTGVRRRHLPRSGRSRPRVDGLAGRH